MQLDAASQADYFTGPDVLDREAELGYTPDDKVLREGDASSSEQVQVLNDMADLGQIDASL